jgi:hypothetical protein
MNLPLMTADELRQSGKGNGRGIMPVCHLAVRAKPEDENRSLAVLDRVHQELRHLVP